MKPVLNPFTGKFDLVEPNTDLHIGWSMVEIDKTVKNVKNRITRVTKYEKQSGFIKHSGFIKGDMQ